jgi:hypothetical protein
MIRQMTCMPLGDFPSVSYNGDDTVFVLPRRSLAPLMRCPGADHAARECCKVHSISSKRCWTKLQSLLAFCHSQQRAWRGEEKAETQLPTGGGGSSNAELCIRAGDEKAELS